MSIICKLFGHHYDEVKLGRLVIGKDGARTSATSQCTRCNTTRIQGLSLDAKEVIDNHNATLTALEQSDDLLRSAATIADRSGKTTAWTKLTDALVEQLLNNNITLKASSDSVFSKAHNPFMTTPRVKAK